MELIAESLGSDLSQLGMIDDAYFGELDHGEIRFYVDRMLDDSEISQLEVDITAQGVYLTGPIMQDANTLVIDFQKRLAPLAIIGIIVGVLAVVIFGFQIFLTVKYGIPMWVWFAGGIILLVMFMKSDTGKAATGAATTVVLRGL